MYQGTDFTQAGCQIRCGAFTGLPSLEFTKMVVIVLGKVLEVNVHMRFLASSFGKEGKGDGKGGCLWRWYQTGDELRSSEMFVS